ncbi:MAG: PAS domain-containing protein, partial [Thermodesulfobacteriota bacterium]
MERFGEEGKRIEEIFFDLFNATEEVALLMEREGIILVANENAARLYGVPLERLPGRSIYDLIPADRVKSSQEKVKTVVNTRRPVRFEGKLGEKVFENSIYPVLNDGKAVER